MPRNIKNNNAKYVGGGLYVTKKGNAKQTENAVSGIINNNANENGENIFKEQ